MKREKIYGFAVSEPLDEPRRQAIEDNIEKNAALSPKPFDYGWEEDADVLHIMIDPVTIEVDFQPGAVDVFATAPAWAKLGFTQKKRAEVRALVERVLAESGFTVAEQPAAATA